MVTYIRYEIFDGYETMEERDRFFLEELEKMKNEGMLLKEN